MTFVKGLMLGTAAAFVATAGAQAADLPLKAKAVEYVKVCSLYGAGFYYIPGTDTCIKLGGYTRAEVAFNASGMTETPAWNGSCRPGQPPDERLPSSVRVRTSTSTPAPRPNTAWSAPTSTRCSPGPRRSTRSPAATRSASTSPSSSSPASPSVRRCRSSRRRGTARRATSARTCSAATTPRPASTRSSYTAQFGNGVSGTIALEDQTAYRQAQASTTCNIAGSAAPASAATGCPAPAPAYQLRAGTQIPDIVGKIRVDQAWGLFQVSAAAHKIRASYYNPAHRDLRSPGRQVGLRGAGRPVAQEPADRRRRQHQRRRHLCRRRDPLRDRRHQPERLRDVWQQRSGAAYQSIAFGFGCRRRVRTNGGGIETTKAWGIRGAFNHNWNPNWATSVFGCLHARSTSAAPAARSTPRLCSRSRLAATFTGNPNFNIAQIGTRTAWTPVKNLTFSGEVHVHHARPELLWLHRRGAPPAATKPTARLRVQGPGHLDRRRPRPAHLLS